MYNATKLAGAMLAILLSCQAFCQNKNNSNAVEVAKPKVETKFLCKCEAFGEDHYFVDFATKTVRTDGAVNAGGAHGPDKWVMRNVRITETAISFTQQIDFGKVLLTRSVVIGRKDGSFTNNGKIEGTCTVVQKFQQ